jgi:hypothetical protein
MTAVVQREMGRGPRGERWQSTGRRGKALADDGGALVEVNGGRGFAKNGEALVEDCMVVRGTRGGWWRCSGAKFWQPDGEEETPFVKHAFLQQQD